MLRASNKPLPLFFQAASGSSRMTDVDRNSYIDYSQLAWGPLILGHSHPEVVERGCQPTPRDFGCLWAPSTNWKCVWPVNSAETIPCAEQVVF